MGATTRRWRRRRRQRRTIINNILIIIIIIQHGGHTQADHYSGYQRTLSNWTFETSLISDVGLITHPCYGQLTPVKTRYPLTSITWPYCGLKFRAHRGQLFFFKLTADQVLVSNWIAGSSQAKLDAASTSSSKHLYSRRYSCLGGKWFGKKTSFSCIFSGFNRKQVGHYSLRVCERKDRVVWEGFNHAGAVIGRCCVLNRTVLPLKILNWSSFLGRDGK